MFIIDRIYNTYQASIKEIQEVNESIDQICSETEGREDIKAFKTKGINNTILLKVQLKYSGNNMEYSVSYKDLLEKYINFSKHYYEPVKNVTTKDKLIVILEEMAKDIVIGLAHTVN